MKSSVKLLTAMIVALLLTVSFNAVAYASELDAAAATQGTTEASEGTLSTDKSMNRQAADASLQNTAESEPEEDDMDLLLQEGYYLDEQGKIRYEAPATQEDTEEALEEAIEDASEEEAKEEVKEPEEEEALDVQKPSYSESDLRLLACLVYSEAGSQNYNGMLAVANVVLNRAKSDAYSHANTIKEVIYDNKWSVQFAVTIKNKSGESVLDKALKLYDSRKFTGSNAEYQKKAMNRAIKAAKAALTGSNNIGDYLCFQNKRSKSSIKKKYSSYKIVDDHIFFRTK